MVATSLRAYSRQCIKGAECVVGGRSRAICIGDPLLHCYTWRKSFICNNLAVTPPLLHGVTWRYTHKCMPNALTFSIGCAIARARVFLYVGSWRIVVS